MQETIPWIEKYRPRKLENMTQDPALLDLLKNSVRTRDIPHYLFYGPPGTGKTSAILAIAREIFKEQFSNRVFECNASDDRGINAVREKITHEAKKYVAETESDDGTIIPPYKIIILDEADSMTDEAQDALRVIIEQYSTVTRFCFICNYISKITDAIKSRCSPVYFKKLDTACMVGKLKEIATKESMILEQNILDTMIEVSNGDMRKAIMLLQNLKYLYNFKHSINKPLGEMNLNELILVPNFSSASNTNLEILESDIYEIAACINIEKAAEIISKVIQCQSIIEITILCKKIIAMGYPIDNVLSQLNKVVIQSNELTEYQKALIFVYSGKIFLRIKECANEYIQLLDYLTCIYNIINKKLKNK